jgi:hypothetical protein
MKSESSELNHQKTQARILHEGRAITRVLKHFRNFFTQSPPNLESLMIGNRLYDEEMRERYRV